MRDGGGGERGEDAVRGGVRARRRGRARDGEGATAAGAGDRESAKRTRRGDEDMGDEGARGVGGGEHRVRDADDEDARRGDEHRARARRESVRRRRRRGGGRDRGGAVSRAERTRGSRGDLREDADRNRAGGFGERAVQVDSARRRRTVRSGELRADDRAVAHARARSIGSAVSRF